MLYHDLWVVKLFLFLKTGDFEESGNFSQLMGIVLILIFYFVYILYLTLFLTSCI